MKIENSFSIRKEYWSHDHDVARPPTPRLSNFYEDDMWKLFFLSFFDDLTFARPHQRQLSSRQKRYIEMISDFLDDSFFSQFEKLVDVKEKVYFPLSWFSIYRRTYKSYSIQIEDISLEIEELI